MRQIFFFSVVVVGIGGFVLYIGWVIAKQLYEDWQLGRGVKELQAESEQRRRQRDEKQATRLDNGCEHKFVQSFAGLPPDTCVRCGLERIRPSGPCDHVWKLSQESVPCSYCEKCGRRYSHVQ